ncbi:MAG: hypothetical protein KJ882_01460, partial [Proteobacteria bacterium]|nr:hypothetical protein [Pseudomonadota bacterium]
MQLIQLYDTFLSLGRLAVIMELGRVSKKTDAQLHSDLVKFCAMDTDIAPNFDNAKKLMIADPPISWPPGDISEWARISESFNKAARSGDPRLEIFWRIAGALGWTLWVPLPEGTKDLFREQLNELGFSHEEVNDILGGLLSKEDGQRLEAGERIRKFVRSLSVSDDYRFLQNKTTQQESRTSESQLPIFHRRSVPHEQDLVFVLMPFTESWSEYIWKEEIQKSVHQYQSTKLRCMRADDLFGHDVMIDIYESITKAR